jgi:hypothetical protein
LFCFSVERAAELRAPPAIDRISAPGKWDAGRGWAR